ncbi:MAG: FtsW/RodA/SpoVE family cell cycle protein [Ruminococcus sp.]|nr:FtsW/RodA/SpoVE family cell cycle protein [Ruminococcus sp.]
MKRKSNLSDEYSNKSDIFLWILTLSAIIYSLLLISSMQRSGSYNYLRTQIISILIGVISAIIICFADYNYIIDKWYISAITAVILAGLVFMFGIQVSGTDDTAWIRLPMGFTVQPSEFIKICFIITFTKHLAYLKENEILKNLSSEISLVIHALIPIIVIHLQGDDGTVLIFCFIFITMSFVAGVQLRYFIIMIISIIIGIPIIWNFFMNNEHRNRILALLDLDGNSMSNYGWQQYQGKVSIASGKIFGSGLFNGKRVKSGIVPEQENDFILTVAGEEIGFIGCMLLLIILFAIMLRIIAIAKKCKNINGTLICCGVFTIIASQTIVNIGMVLGFLPVIGITLPLFSSGGSSALSILICIGLVQSVKKHNSDNSYKVIISKKRKQKLYNI